MVLFLKVSWAWAQAHRISVFSYVEDSTRLGCNIKEEDNLVFTYFDMHKWPYIGLGNNFSHIIYMRNNNPVYISQFQIADAYREGLYAQVKNSWSNQQLYNIYNCVITFSIVLTSE